MTEVSAGTLTDFLLHRIAEDEAAAREEAERRRVEALTSAWAFGVAHLTFGGPFDPARVLAECEAKRRIVQWHALVVGEDQGGKPVMGCANCIGAEAGQTFTIEGPCMTLRLLALPYAGHAEFNPAWRL